MEIVKQGDKVYKCSVCGCEMKISSKEDIHYGLVGSYDGLIFHEPMYGDFLRCPQCNNKVVIRVD